MQEQNCFHRLGLPRRFSLDEREAERQYLARSRAIHPDFHATGPSADLSASLELSAALNEAYNTLRDPFRRADYLIILEGGPSAAEQKQMPAVFLAEMLEARERIEEVRAERTNNPDAVSLLATEFSLRFAKLLGEVAVLFSVYEKLPDGDPRRAETRVRIRSLLNAANYVRGLIRDLNGD